LELLRYADFAIYAHQDLWLRQPAPVSGPVGELRPAQALDMPAVLALYSTLVPGLIKQAEPPPTAADLCYLAHRSEDGISGMVAAWRGVRFALIEVYLRPEIQREARGIINAALLHLQADSRPVYCRLRRYIGWPDSLLDDLGFTHLATQAFMVRHLAARIKRHVGKKLFSFDEGFPVTAYIDVESGKHFQN